MAPNVLLHVYLEPLEAAIKSYADANSLERAAEIICLASDSEAARSVFRRYPQAIYELLEHKFNIDSRDIGAVKALCYWSIENRNIDLGYFWLDSASATETKDIQLDNIRSALKRLG